MFTLMSGVFYDLYALLHCAADMTSFGDVLSHCHCLW